MVSNGSTELDHPHSLVLDPRLRVLKAIPIEGDGLGHVERVLDVIDAQPPVETIEGFAPVLVLPGIFEPEFCRELIDYFHKNGGRDSGIMKEQGDKTVEVVDHIFKRRRDCHISDPRPLQGGPGPDRPASDPRDLQGISISRDPGWNGT